MPLLFGAYSIVLPFGRDQGIHAAIAAGLQHGFATYREIYNIKPPMTTAVHWLALELFGHHVASIRILDLLLVMGCACALAGLALRYLRSPLSALSVAIGFSSMYYALTYWDGAQTDGWGAVCVVFATAAVAAAWTRAPGRARSGAMLLAGVLMGVAFAFKYTVAGAGVIVFAPALCRSGAARFYGRDLLCFVAGGLLFLAGLGAFLAAAGVLADFLEIQAYLLGYVSYSKLSLWDATVDLLQQMQLAAAIALLGGVIMLARLFSGRSSLYVVLAALLLASGWLAGAVQGKGLVYHFLPALIGLSLLFGLAVEKMEGMAAARPAAPTLLWIAVFAATLVATPGLKRNIDVAADLLRGTTLRQQWARYDDSGDFSFIDTVAFNDILTRYRDARQPFFVWGFETALYFLQDAAPMHRYPYVWPLAVDYHDGRYAADLIGRLTSSPPVFFVVQKRDATPWATGHAMASDELLRYRYPGIHRFLTEGYVKVEETPRFELWQRVGA